MQMEVFKQVTLLKQHIEALKCQGKKIGLVPTMGALHQGHLSLVNASMEDNDITVVTIYVNPIQFNNPEDFEKYPNDIEADLKALETQGCDIVFCPDNKTMYPEKPKLQLIFKSMEGIMEDKFRPGHFNGVGVVVTKFFNTVKPHRAYFGQKDLQQFHIIKQLVNDFSMDIELRCMPVIREVDGLAMSSRNKRLKNKHRKKAVAFYEALKTAQEVLQDGGDVATAKAAVDSQINVAGVALEYFEIADANTLTILEKLSDQKNVALCIAGYVGEVRLIDNIIFNFVPRGKK